MVYIRCDILPGAFSGELEFEIALNGKKHHGLASRRYFLAKDFGPIGEVTSKTPGLIQGRVVNEEEGDKVLVAIPDGEVVRVMKSNLVLHEQQHVPVGS
jgi:hypothetical protein